MTEEKKSKDIKPVVEEKPIVIEPSKAEKPKPEPHPLEGCAVKGNGLTYWIIEEGKRREVPDMATFYMLGLRPVQHLSAVELEAIPLGRPFRSTKR
jgi:hypothetical protein